MLKETYHAQAAGRRLRVRKLRADGKKVTGHGPTLVFLHEGLGCIEHWKDFPERLCRAVGLDGLIYDRKGYGGSEPLEGGWPKDYLFDEAFVDLPALLSSERIEDAILAGHSDGGSIALLAASAPESPVRGIIVEAAHIFVEDETVAGIREFMDMCGAGGIKEKLSRFHGNRTDAVVKRWADRWLSPDFRDWSIEDFLPGISCPVLVIQGQNDEYATARQVEGIVAGVGGPVRSEMIPGCGHSPHFQAPELVLPLMADFIVSLTARRRGTG